MPLIAPNVLTSDTGPTFARDGTRKYFFLEEDGSVTYYSCVGTDYYTHGTWGDTTERGAGITAGLWHPTKYEWGYGLGITISGADWRLVGGSPSFPSSTAMPVVSGGTIIDTHTFGSSPAPLIQPGISGSVSYQCTSDGSVVYVVWGNAGFTNRFVRIGGSNHTISEIVTTPTISVSNMAGIVTVGGDRVFRIYGSGGVVYSDSHATRWDDATIGCASDRWFYVLNVKDWSSYITEEPSSVFGSAPTRINMLISMDGSKRVRICQYDEDNSRYDNPTMPTIGSAPSTAIVDTTDCVKISSSLDYALPDTIDYPPP
jgi:hypothetical protein